MLCFVATSALPSTSRAVNITQIASMQISPEETLIPAESGWIVHSPTTLKIYSDDMQIVHRQRIRLNERLAFSENANYYSVLKYNDNSPTTFSLLRFDVFSISGDKAWSEDRPRASSIRLSDASGRAVGIVGAMGIPTSELDVYGTDRSVGYSLEVTNLADVVFGPQGNYLLVNSADSGLVAYDTLGTVAFRYGPTRDFCLSSNGEFVATISPGGINFFKRGLKINSVTLPAGLSGSVLDMAFNEDASKLAILESEDLRIFKLPTLDLLWEGKPPVAGARFSSFDASDNGLLAAGYDIPVKQNSVTTHTKGGVVILGWDGAEHHRMNLDYADWSIGYPRVRFSGGGALLKVASRNGAYLLAVSM